MRRISLAVLLAVLLAGAWSGRGRSDDEPSAPPPGTHDFGRKIVLVHMKGSAKIPGFDGGYFEDAKVRRLGDTFYISGVTPVTGQGADTPKARIWIPITEVGLVWEFDSLEDAVKLYQAGQAGNNEN